MLPFAGRNIGLPRKLKGPRHVLHLHNGIRGVTCSSHTNELMTRDKKETRGFAWTGRWMFVLQSLYPLNWLLLCFHSISFSLLVYLRPPSYFKFATRTIKPHFPANSVFFLESEYYEWTCRNSKEINLAKLNSRISVEVLTLPVAAEPTLRATVHVQFY